MTDFEIGKRLARVKIKVLSNRQKNREPRGKGFWCACDMNKVWAGEKCSVCGRRSGEFRDKP